MNFRVYEVEGDITIGLYLTRDEAEGVRDSLEFEEEFDLEYDVEQIFYKKKSTKKHKVEK